MPTGDARSGGGRLVPRCQGKVFQLQPPARLDQHGVAGTTGAGARAPLLLPLRLRGFEDCDGAGLGRLGGLGGFGGW